MKNNNKWVSLVFLSFFFLMSLNLTINKYRINLSNAEVKYEVNDLHNSEFWEASRIIILNGDWSSIIGEPWCSGGGIASNPYIIENISIDAGGIGSCIDIEGGNRYFIIRNCILRNSGVSWYNGGIDLSQTKNGIIINNTCNYNNRNGIRLYQCSNISVYNNNLDFNLISGIEIDNCWSNIEIINNSVTSNGEYGVYVDHASNSNIFNNTVNNNKEGIYLESDSSSLNIIDNTVSSNDNGISLIDSYQNNCSKNVVKDNNQNGIYLEDSRRNDIAENTISFNTENGIKLEESNYNDITENNISFNDDNGIYLEDSDGNGIAENIISLNTENGIKLELSNDNDIDGNIISNSNKWGIVLYDKSNYNNISNNNLYDNIKNLGEDTTCYGNYYYNNNYEVIRFSLTSPSPIGPIVMICNACILICTFLVFVFKVFKSRDMKKYRNERKIIHDQLIEQSETESRELLEKIDEEIIQYNSKVTKKIWLIQIMAGIIGIVSFMNPTLTNNSAIYSETITIYFWLTFLGVHPIGSGLISIINSIMILISFFILIITAIRIKVNKFSSNKAFNLSLGSAVIIFIIVILHIIETFLGTFRNFSEGAIIGFGIPLITISAILAIIGGILAKKWMLSRPKIVPEFLNLPLFTYGGGRINCVKCGVEKAIYVYSNTLETFLTKRWTRTKTINAPICTVCGYDFLTWDEKHKVKWHFSLYFETIIIIYSILNFLIITPLMSYLGVIGIIYMIFLVAFLPFSFIKTIRDQRRLRMKISPYKYLKMQRKKVLVKPEGYSRWISIEKWISETFTTETQDYINDINFCKYCGNILIDNESICGNCGAIVGRG